MGLLSYFLVPSTPRNSKFLSEKQKEWSLSSFYTALHVLTSPVFSIIMSRLERDRPSIEPVDKFTFKEVIRSASSPHVIMVFIMFFMSGTMLYGLALFLPSIVSQLGFSPNKTQLLSVGPFAAGFFGERFILQRISQCSFSSPL